MAYNGQIEYDSGQKKYKLWIEVRGDGSWGHFKWFSTYAAAAAYWAALQAQPVGTVTVTPEKRGVEYVRTTDGGYYRAISTPVPIPPPGPSPVPGPGPSPWDGGEDGGWDPSPTPLPDTYGGGTSSWGYGGTAAEAWGSSALSLWDYPSMWYSKDSMGMWNYSNAWSGFTSTGGWDYGGTWEAPSAGGGFLSGLFGWFTSLFE
jgi:hypothetical protein